MCRAQREFRKDAEKAIQSFWNSIFINRYRDINEKVPAPPTSRAVAPLWLARHFLCFRLMRNSDDRPPEISVR